MLGASTDFVIAHELRHTAADTGHRAQNGGNTGGLQAGGGIDSSNAALFLEKGASHVIVTSAVFKDGTIDYDELKRIVRAAGKEHLVLNLSVKERDGSYFIVTDRWQKYTDTILDENALDMLSGYCDEYLVHAAHAEGKKAGIDTKVVDILAHSPIPVTYAGGIHTYKDIDLIRTIGGGRVDYTIGSALDLFGGELSFEEIITRCS
jgi:phosphoribosylformimino-5-aminoimidazole carboxamide ribotide isomerase